MDVGRETMMRMLEEALEQAKMVTWRLDLDPPGRIVALRQALNQPFATTNDEVFEAAKIIRRGILTVFEKCCASGDAEAALDKFIGVVEEQFVKVRGGHRDPADILDQFFQ